MPLAEAAKWRQLAIDRGLLMADPDISSGRASDPVQRCGVSLAWLERFASSLETSDFGKAIETTADIPAKLAVLTTALSGSKCRYMPNGT